jgi:hypothetical protein
LQSDVGWSPARWYLLAVAVSHVPLGVIGLVVDRSFPIGAEAAREAASHRVFGVLETNGWHSLGALALGVLAASILVAAPERARRVALLIGVFNLGLLLSLIAWDPRTFWIASNGTDQIIHSATALGGIVTGLLTPRRG